MGRKRKQNHQYLIQNQNLANTEMESQTMESEQKKRIKTYVELINKLSSSPSEEVNNILAANLDLVDAGLVQVMAKYAEYLEKQGNNNAANYLMEMAKELAKILGISQENSETLSCQPKATQEEYLKFLMKVLQATSDSNWDSKVVYPIFQQNLDKLDEFLAQILTAWATQKLAEVEAEEAKNITTVIFFLW